MRSVAAIILALSLASPAWAQVADPALDDLAAPQEGPSELDALGANESSEFPDIGEEQLRKPVSVKIRALNKITAKYTDISIAMNETAPFGQLEITPRFCDKRPPEEFPETTAFLEIRDTTAAAVSDLKEPAAKAKKRKAEEKPTPAALPADVAADDKALAFSGWMFASTPALSALEHPVYDVWVIDCKTVVVSR
jgi:hypothetical protein